MKILFIGDIVGKGGRRAVKELLPGIIGRHDVDLVIANGENAAGGFGLTRKVVEELFETDVDLITSGNHIWDKKEIYQCFDAGMPLIRPGNYPPEAPGKGRHTLETAAGEKLSVINASGRVFMESLDCPFRYLESEVEDAAKESAAILIDFHAEATSEKQAICKFLDGKVSAIVGTHTHVQTADEKITRQGTGYITDVGMTGGTDSVIGMKADGPLTRFLTGQPVKFEVAMGDIELQGALLEINGSDGTCHSIERVKKALQ